MSNNIFRNFKSEIINLITFELINYTFGAVLAGGVLFFFLIGGRFLARQHGDLVGVSRETVIISGLALWSHPC